MDESLLTFETTPVLLSQQSTKDATNLRKGQPLPLHDR